MSFESSKQEYGLDEKIHFTYNPNPDKNTLCQGDVLEFTDDLKAVLKEIHPYFLKDQYKYFMVLSQSCDLVRRDGKHCKTSYITLAAVRSYKEILEKEFVGKGYAKNVNGYLLMDEKRRTQVYQFVEQLYNNNASDYFFLYHEPALAFPESMVACLKVSVAIKSTLHYDKCLKAKKMELDDAFKAKLGWLAGDMYSRVGTMDWGSLKHTKALKEMYNYDIDSLFVLGQKAPLEKLENWLRDQKTSEITHEMVIKFISDIKVQTKYDQVMDIIEEVIEESCKKMEPKEKENLINQFRSKSILKSLIK